MFICSSSQFIVIHNNNTLNIVASLLTGHAEAGVPHPALPAVADVPGSAQATGAVTILVIAETTRPRPRAQHPASPVVTNIIEVPGGEICQ